MRVGSAVTFYAFSSYIYVSSMFIPQAGTAGLSFRTCSYVFLQRANRGFTNGSVGGRDGYVASPMGQSVEEMVMWKRVPGRSVGGMYN